MSSLARGASPMRVVFLVLPALVLAACQAAPATDPGPAAVQTAPVAEAPLPAPAISPGAARSATATASPAELKRRASPICENAFSALVERGPLIPPFAVMKKSADADAPAWEPAHQLPHVGTLVAADARTLFCITETRELAGSYADGAAAYQVFWEVRAVSWPGGRVIGRGSFVGPPPRRSVVLTPGSREGQFPYARFAAWVFDQVDHPDFIHFGEAVTALAVSPDGRKLAFGTAPGGQNMDREFRARIFLLDPADLQILTAYEGHPAMVTSLALAPDGMTLASGGLDLFVKLWDLSTGRLLGQVSLAEAPNAMLFSPDGTGLAVASNLSVSLIDPAARRLDTSIPATGGDDLTFSPDGSEMYLHSSGRIKIVDPAASRLTLTFPDPFAEVPTVVAAADGTPHVTYETPEAVDGFALSPDGARIVTYTVQKASAPGAENVRLVAWNAETGKYLSEVRFTGDLIQGIEFSPRGDVLALGNGSEVWLWRVPDWQLRDRLAGHTAEIVDLAFSPDGAKLFSASRDGTLRAWSVPE